jgi:hypothetical protein
MPELMVYSFLKLKSLQKKKKSRLTEMKQDAEAKHFDDFISVSRSNSASN